MALEPVPAPEGHDDKDEGNHIECNRSAAPLTANREERQEGKHNGNDGSGERAIAVAQGMILLKLLRLRVASFRPCARNSVRRV